MTHHSITWTSEDGQRNLDMSGDYDQDDRAGAIIDAASDILNQSAESDRPAALAGTIDGETVADILDGYDLMDYDTADTIRAASPA